MTTRLVALAAAVLVACVVTAMTATNLVAASGAGSHIESITADAIKPAECAGVAVTTKVTGSGTFAGTSQADLILGSGGADDIAAHEGSDCILAGGGDDLIAGGAGADVCVGGPGTDTFDATCETTIQ